MIKKRVSIFCFIFMMVTTVVWAKPDSAYIDNGNGTVTDIETKLMWQQATADENYMTWYVARTSYCPDLSLAGYTGWRLPTLDELRALVDRSWGYNPTINHMYFPNTVSSFYWSSTTTKPNTPGALGVAFYYGDDSISNKTNSYYVRAVRGGWYLVISPLSREVTKDAGSTTFSVSNTETDATMPWTATITAGGDWLSITSGASGTNAGTITCAYTANTSSSRSGTIRVTAYGGGTSTQKDVTVTQNPPGPQTACTAKITTIGDDFLLHIPNIPNFILTFWMWADLVNVFDVENPTLILFRLTESGFVENPSSFSCEASTFFSGSPPTIHIPDVLLPDKSTRLWVDLEYRPDLSAYEAKNYGIVFSK